MNENETLSPLAKLKWVVIFSSIGIALIFFGSVFDPISVFRRIIDLLAGAFFVGGVMELGIKAHLEKIENKRIGETQKQLAKFEEERKKLIVDLDKAVKWGKEMHEDGKYKITDLRLTKIERGISKLEKNQNRTIRLLHRNN